ncbi:MAG: sigma 54-interacting transcriptional regulator [Tepidanaerobacteraceae bacterium]|jgi:transcriptional regulator with PAS, ATPase and Fis domain|nr:sigma 54-interacting transcriptional regulator [Tepidanaerobacteraceae bacterium]
MDYQSYVIELIDEGIIAIDSMAHIKIYNRIARDIFGLNPDEGPGHPEGKIAQGDIVIIADNLLGADDGGLEPEDLRAIGIEPSGIERGDAVVAIGTVGGRTGSGVFNRLDKKIPGESLSVETSIDGLKLKAQIDFDLKRLRATVDGRHYDYIFRWAAGHMVIVDRASRDVKFYQTRGYTARQEELKAVLCGKPFRGKGKFGQVFQILERHINEIHPDSHIIRSLIAVARGESCAVRGLESMINGIPVRCSIEPLVVDGNNAGAFLKVLDITELKAVQIERERVLSSLENLENRIRKERIQKEAFKDVVRSGEKIRRVVEMAKRAAETSSTVLLTGESGTGKGLFAEAIHRAGCRREGPFVYVNCASIPENLLESELFGHEKGAFTGAVAEKPGKFELADGGTIFLDEIAELPLTLQAKLLHVIQKRTFTRVGGVKPIQVDIRIIAASNRDLEDAVRKGIFREDLFYRINVISIKLPPLREHREDLYPLVSHILPRVAERVGKKAVQISGEVMKIFLDYDWPGNVRELENVLERAAIMADGDIIMTGHLPEYILGQNKEDNIGGMVTVKKIGPLKELLTETEINAVKKALEICGGNRKKAMEMLGVGKTNFYKKLKKARSS